jgi:hypothetical protein
MLLTARQAHDLGLALLDASGRSMRSEQQQMVVCTVDTATAIDYQQGCSYDPDTDTIVF